MFIILAGIFGASELLDLAGILLVLVGVSGGYWTTKRKYPADPNDPLRADKTRHLHADLYEYTLILGLGLELIAYPIHLLQNSARDKAAADTKDVAEQAKKQARLASDKTADAEAARAQLEKQVEQYKIKVKELEILSSERHISQEQSNAFLQLSHDAVKGAVGITVTSGSKEVMKYALEIKAMLVSAGYKCDTPTSRDTVAGGAPDGVVLGMMGQENFHIYAQSLWAAINKSGIKTEGIMPSYPGRPQDGFIHIIVGEKPRTK